jgi:LemA protein
MIHGLGKALKQNRAFRIVDQKGAIMAKNLARWVLIGLAVAALSSCGYNLLQGNEEAVFRAWADIDSQLQRRSDLIPNLVATVKGYASHERETLEAVIAARARATQVTIKAEDLGDEQAMARYQAAQGELSSVLGRLLAVAEAYPDLKANQNFLDLQNQLEGTENRISVARQRYNEAVQTFNFSIRSFPYSLTNNLFLHLKRKEPFRADEAAREAPKVEF